MQGYVGQPVIDRNRYEVVVAASDTQVLATLREALEGDGLSVVAQARDASEAVEATLRHRPHVCLFAKDLAGGGGISASDRITSKISGTRIAMFAPAIVVDEALQAAQAGVDG